MSLKSQLEGKETDAAAMVEQKNEARSQKLQIESLGEQLKEAQLSVVGHTIHEYACYRLLTQ